MSSYPNIPMSLSHSPGARTSLKFWGVQGASHACSILPIESDRCLKSERTWCTIYGVLRRSAKNPRGGFVNVVYVRFNLLLYATLRGRLTVLGIDYQCARPSVQCSFLIVHERRLDLGTSSLPLLWHAWNLISLSKQHPICPLFLKDRQTLCNSRASHGLAFLPLLPRFHTSIVLKQSAYVVSPKLYPY